VTCGQQYLWNSGEIHAGHWIHDKLDYDPRNVHPQCKNCNYKYNKNTNTAYAIYMARTYGVDEMENIRKHAYQKGNAYTRQELEEIIEQYS
jgi:Bacteriophage Lambda NinG protein